MFLPFSATAKLSEGMLIGLNRWRGGLYVEGLCPNRRSFRYVNVGSLFVNPLE